MDRCTCQQENAARDDSNLDHRWRVTKRTSALNPLDVFEVAMLLNAPGAIVLPSRRAWAFNHVEPGQRDRPENGYTYVLRALSIYSDMQRRPTSFDIAALAGVSQPTVSRALSGNPAVSEETRRRVLEAAEQLNYKVDKNASGLRRQQAKTLALLFFEEWPGGALINPFYLSMIGPMVRRCAEHGYDLLISFQQLSSDWHVDYEDCRKADGIILLGYGDYLEYRPRLEQLVARGAHFVRWGSGGETQIGVTVSSDNEQGGFDATTHLLKEGRRRIAFIGTAGPCFPEVQERWRGYCRALHAAGIKPDEILRVDAMPDESDGRNAADQLLRRGVEFDAIFAASDVAAIGAMHALQHAGRNIPEIAVVGFDDIPAASLASPPLTTITQSARQAAEALIDTLFESIETGSASNRVLPVRLTVRESSILA